MRKILLTSIISLLFVYVYPQKLTDQVEISIKEEVRLHPDVHLKYAHTIFSIDRYIIQDPYILIYSNTTGSFYLINQENQLIVDQLDIFKTFPKVKILNVHVWDNKSGARVKLRSPFYNNGIAMGNYNIEPYKDSIYYAGLLKLKNKYFLLLVDILNDKINTSLKEYNIEDYFEKPRESKIEFQDHSLYMDLHRASIWNNQELYFYTFDPYVKKLPKDSTRSYDILYDNSIYSLNNNELTSVIKPKNTNSFYSDASYATTANKLLILNNDLDSVFLYSDDLKRIKSKKIPRNHYDTITRNNKKFVLKNGIIIKDGFSDMIYIIVTSYNKNTYSIYSTDNELTQFTLIKTFLTDLTLKKTKIYKGNIYFLINTNASEPAKLFHYDLYKTEKLGDTILLNSTIQQAISLFRGNLSRLWFKQMFGLENIKGDVYNLPKNHIRNRIENTNLTKEEIEKQKSIEGLIELINGAYKANNAQKILANYLCYDKFEIEILEKSVKKENFSAKTDSIFYKSNLKELFEGIAQPDFKPIGEMKTYHYEIITDDGWHLFLTKIEDYWYLSSVVYKEED